jgi:hypothetical protein
MPRRKQLPVRVNQKHLQIKQTLIHHEDSDLTEPLATPEDVRRGALPEEKDDTKSTCIESKAVAGKNWRIIARIIYSFIKY